MPFLSSDANLLQAILFGCGSSSISLHSILNTTVSLGHEPPTFVELDGGLARLIAAELVTFDGKLVTPTPAAIEIATQVMSENGSVDHFHGKLIGVLAALPLPASVQTNPTTGLLSPMDFDRGFMKSV